MDLTSLETKSIFELDNSDIILSQSVFLNLNLSQHLLLMTNYQLNNFTLIIKECIFEAIIMTSYNLQDLFYLENISGNIYIENSNFSETSYFNNIIYVENLNGFIFINLVNFSSNEIFSQIISLNEVYNVTITNTILCWTNNKKGKLYYDGGGSIRLYNIIVRNIINLQILYSFSAKTAFGLKIIDISNRKNINLTQSIVKPIFYNFINNF